MDVELTSKTFIGLYRTFRELESGLPLVSLSSMKATHHAIQSADESLLESDPGDAPVQIHSLLHQKRQF